MTSEERRDARFQRRRALRDEKKKRKMLQIGNYNDIFTYINLYDAFYNCRTGVRWKASVQKFEATLPLVTLEMFNQTQKREFKPLKFFEFDINERGKMRHIMAMTIADRCIQKVLCEKYLTPVLEPKLIFDNGASQKGKGTDFSLRRLKRQLLYHYKKYGREGYILQYDFSKYFNRIDHKILLELLKKDIPDKDIYRMMESIIHSFGDEGLGLGSQVSQTCAIYYPTLLDRYFKETLHIKGYGRYMDDGYALCKDLDEVNKCKQGLKEMADKLHIVLNEKKVTVTKLSNTFIFLKKRFQLTENGQVIIKISKQSAHKARRRLRKMFQKYSGQPENMHYILDSYRSWYGMSAGTKNYFITENYKKLFNKLYQEELNKSC